MRQRIGWLIVVGLLCGAGGSALAGEALTSTAYRAELDRLAAATSGLERRPGAIDAVARSLPLSWRVDTGGRRFDIPSDPLRRDLDQLRRTRDERTAARLRATIQQWRDALDAYEAAPPDRGVERARLTAILASREFVGVHGPTWYERLKQRVLGWLVNLLGAMLGSSSVPLVSRILIYGLLALALLAGAIWVARILRTSAEAASIRPAPGAPSARPYEAWLAGAREAAARGEWRDAVRLAYWASISSLESSGLWPADRARTPREYLRLVPRESARRGPLASITTTFELVWYGRHAADAATFSGVLADLERLGCR
jgi:hypothetical protein